MESGHLGPTKRQRHGGVPGWGVWVCLAWKKKHLKSSTFLAFFIMEIAYVLQTCQGGMVSPRETSKGLECWHLLWCRSYFEDAVDSCNISSNFILRCFPLSLASLLKVKYFLQHPLARWSLKKLLLLGKTFWCSSVDWFCKLRWWIKWCLGSRLRGKRGLCSMSFSLHRIGTFVGDSESPGLSSPKYLETKITQGLFGLQKKPCLQPLFRILCLFRNPKNRNSKSSL